MKIPFKWEIIDDPAYEETQRAKVIGGWLIHKTVRWNYFETSSMVFIPDKNHEWEIE